jgi:alpha-1,6-mannosyltransferase
MAMRPDPTSRRALFAVGALVVGYLAIDVLAAAPRSPLVPVLPAGVGAPGWLATIAGWVGLDRVGPVTATVISTVVLGVLVGAFGVAVWEAWRNRLSLPVALAAAGLSLALALPAPLLLSRDVHSYAAYGRTLSVHHANPYDVAPSGFPGDPFTPVVSREWFQTRSVYGPGFTLASAAIARAWSGSPEATITAFKALSAVAVLAAVALVAGIARRARPGREAVAVATLGLNPVVIVHTVGGGHNDALVAALLVAALAVGLKVVGGRSHADERGHSTPRPVGGQALGTTVLLVVAASVKVIAVLPLLGWFWALGRIVPPRDRARAIAVHVAVAAGVTAALAAPVFAGWRTITAMANLASRQGWASGARLVARGAQGIGRAIGGHDLGTALGSAVYAGFLVSFVLLLWRLLVARPPGGSAPLWDVWGPSLLLFALASPYLLPWYAAWFVPFLALLSDRRLALAGLAVGGLLTLTGIPAEPAADPGLWRWMVVGVHYAVAPFMLALYAFVARAILRSDGPRPAQSPPLGWRTPGRRPGGTPDPARPAGAG